MTEINWEEIGRETAESVRRLSVTQQELEPLITGTIERIKKEDPTIPFSPDQQEAFSNAFRARYRQLSQRQYRQCIRRRTR